MRKRWQVWVIARKGDGEVVEEFLKRTYRWRKWAEYMAPFELPGSAVQLALHIHYDVYLTYEIRDVYA